jgi:hypothetical protein
MPELKRITFSVKTDVGYVMKTTKGITRRTILCCTKGPAGTDRISLWREILDIIERKGVAVRAPFLPKANMAPSYRRHLLTPIKNVQGAGLGTV